MALEQWLIEEALISDEQLVQVRARQDEMGLTLQMALLDLKLLDEASLVDLIARKNKLPKAPGPLHRIKVSPKAVSSVPQDLCWQNAIFPFGIDRGSKRLQLAVVDPNGFDRASLGALASFSIDLFVIGPKQLEKAIRKHYLDSMVDDTGAQKKRRFFGYEEITDPGLSPTLSKVVPPREVRPTPPPQEVLRVPPSREERPTPPPLEALADTFNDLVADAKEASSAVGEAGEEEVKESEAPSGSGEIPLPEPTLNKGASQTPRTPLETKQGHSRHRPTGPIQPVPTPVQALEGKPIKKTLTPVAVDCVESAAEASQRPIGAIPTITKAVTPQQLDVHNKRARAPQNQTKGLEGRLRALEQVVIQLADLMTSSEIPEQTRERAHQIVARLRTGSVDPDQT